jgi:hypothetical protein
VIPLHIRDLAYQLSSHPFVKHVKIRNFCLDVQFITGITERWLTCDHDVTDVRRHTFKYAKSEVVPVRIHTEFETEPGDPFASEKKEHPIIQYKEFVKGSFLERRMVIHKFIMQLCGPGWRRIWFPEEALLDDFRNLLKLSSERFWHGDVLLAVGAIGIKNEGAPGRMLMEHFFDTGIDPGRKGTYDDGWVASKLYKAAKRILKGQGDLTRYIMARAVNQQGYGPRIVTPGAYLAILKKFSLSPASVLDACPMFGGKLIAAAAVGARVYRCPNPQPEAEALAKFLGIKVERYTNQPCDVAFIDKDFYPTNILPGHHKHVFRCVDAPRPGIEQFQVMVTPYALRARILNTILHFH